jgi:hypothetical protein
MESPTGDRKTPGLLFLLIILSSLASRLLLAIVLHFNITGNKILTKSESKHYKMCPHKTKIKSNLENAINALWHHQLQNAKSLARS